MYSYDRRASAQAKWISGGSRREVVDEIWKMYKTSYAKIGLHVPSAAGLMKYDKWEVFFDGDTPIAFNLYKSTPLGLKTGLLGSDGSSQAKSIIKNHIKTRYKRGNTYGEVSHAVERLSQGAPVVCAIYVPKVLGKPVTPHEDGVHYAREIKGLGKVTKKLIGNPKGGFSAPEASCPIPQRPGEVLAPNQEPAPMTAADDEAADWMETAEHLCCQCELD